MPPVAIQKEVSTLATFKEFILNIEVTEEERKYFIHICSDWALFCDAVSCFNRGRVMQLLNYLLNERPKSKRLLARCISRFNRVNALKKEALK